VSEPRISDERWIEIGATIALSSSDRNAVDRRRVTDNDVIALLEDLRDCRARREELAAELERATVLGAASVALGAERTRERDAWKENARQITINRDHQWNERDKLAAQLAERDGQVAALTQQLKELGHEPAR
jgi:septal ring factor EnvC (AmiA/AmiB activator)